jgi:hypothetical protein
MNEYGSQEDQQPIMWMRGYPVYAAHFIVAVFVASMLATALLMGFSVAQPWAWLPFSSASVLRGQVWRVATYGLLNPPSLTFVIDMAMLVWFGREVEKFVGRARFMFLFCGIYLLTPLLFTLIGIWRPSVFAGETGAFAIFIAFTTIYPNVAVFFGILSKWIAAVLLGIYSLMALANHDWQAAVSLWSTTAFAFAFMRFHQGLITLPSLRLFRRGPKLRLLRGQASGGEAVPVAVKAGSMAEVDALLDKIAHSGFSSLTAKEKARLDSARDELSKRGSRR